jgi:hypothetical protein
VSVQQIVKFINAGSPAFKDNEMSISTVSRWLTGKTKGSRGETYEKPGRRVNSNNNNFAAGVVAELQRRRDQADSSKHGDALFALTFNYADLRDIAATVKATPEYIDNKAVQRLRFTDRCVFSLPSLFNRFRLCFHV